MDVSPRKLLKRPIEPVDDWLKTEGYLRKASPKDPTCLFRAVSEQIYDTQYYHVRVRKECVEFMRKNKLLFKENISGSMDNYLEQLSFITEWGGLNEIEAMSRLYKREFIIFYGQKMMKKNVTNNGFEKFIHLCHIPPRQYEAVYRTETISASAFCQSLIYQILYKDVFKMSGVDESVQKMLHDNKFIDTRHDRFFIKSNNEIRRQLAKKSCTKLDNGDMFNDLSNKINNAPFPYRVAKALDPNIYRNTDVDIWQEIKREVRIPAWSRWNNSQLQVGGRCFVQLDFNNDNLEKNNNLQKMEAHDKNGNDSSQNQSELSSKKDTTLLSPSLCIGHIQEMSKNEGPVVVFIEELGEKKTVPYGALKPYNDSKKLTPVSGVISPRKNMSYEQLPKWKTKWNTSIRKLNGPMINGQINNVDRKNNNREVINDKPADKMDNNSSTDAIKGKHDISILNKYTGPENIPSNGNGLSSLQCIEVCPVSVVLNNPPPIKTPSTEKTEDNRCSSPVPTKSNNDIVKNHYNNNNMVIENGSMQTIVPQQTSPSPPMEPFYPPSHSGSPMYPGNVNVICVSPDGNVYAPLPVFGGNVPPGPPIPNVPMDRTPIINVTVPISSDVNCSDLPYSDPHTLRFFFNLGLEYFRYNNMWMPNGSPVTYGHPGYLPAGNMVSLPTSESLSPPSVTSEVSPTQQDNIRQSQYPQRRKSEQSQNQVRMTSSHSNSRNSYPRKDCQDINKGRNESQNASSEYQKTKSTNSSNERTREFNHNNWEPRRGAGPGRFKKNEGRRDNRGNRQGPIQHDVHQRQNNSPPSNKPQNFGNAESSQFQRGNKSEGFNQGQVVHTPVQAPKSSPVPSPSYQPQYNHQPPMYTNVPYYATEAETFYSHANMYPVPYMTQPEANDGSYACQPGLENYPQTMSPIYTPIPYPPPPLYSVPQTPQENWYPIAGQSQFIPTQSIPTVSGASTS